MVVDVLGRAQVQPCRVALGALQQAFGPVQIIEQGTGSGVVEDG